MLKCDEFIIDDSSQIRNSKHKIDCQKMRKIELNKNEICSFHYFSPISRSEISKLLSTRRGIRKEVTVMISELC